MSIYIIADLHLSFNEPKPMNIFGENWENHEEKIKKDWLEKVKEDDTVILPGDFSWAMHLKDTLKDFEFLNNLPGRKILLKGNHDYWWTTVTNMQNFLNENNIKDIDFLHNNSFEIEDKIICGTRGWTLANEESENSKKMLKREAMRLELSIKDAISKYGADKEIIVCMHYPPITKTQITNLETTEIFEILKKYEIKRCFYGHLHSASIKEALQGNIRGVNLNLISADGLDFKLYKI